MDAQIYKNLCPKVFEFGKILKMREKYYLILELFGSCACFLK